MDILEVFSEADLEAIWAASRDDAPDRPMVIAYPGADGVGVLSRDAEGRLQFHRA